MLNPFPELLTFSLLGPMFLRAILGLIFIDLGRFKFKGEKSRWIASLEALHIGQAPIVVKVLGAIEIIGGVMLIIGLYTQIAALVLAILTGTEAYLEYKDATLLKRNFSFYILLFVVLLSLLVTGAGAFAFDIPL